MADTLLCITPVDGSVYVERPLAGPSEIDAVLTRGREAAAAWRQVPLARRQELCSRAVDAFVAKKAEIAEEISWQMGRPVSQSPGEVAGFEERARHMIEIAPEALGDVEPEVKDGFTRFVRREPLGLVFVMAPWNYPYLTAVNSIIPAIMAGNAVVLKHSAQTPLCAERFAQAFIEAGLPEGVFQYLHLGHQDALRVIGDPRVDFVAFTGSVEAGHKVQAAAAQRFIGTGLELGGKDPGYVRVDADIDHAVATLVDGAFFNSGQSCCGIERIYVQGQVFESFIERAVALIRQYRLGNPLDAETTLGPMVRASAAAFAREQVREAVAAGAEALIDPAGFPADAEGSPYMAPQILIGVDHTMRVMTEETFGPVVGVMRVASDEEAIALMNDSDFGLTAAIFTRDADAALEIGARVEAGTWFMNRCDYLDPALAWTGVKDSGRGCTLSRVGYEQLTRPKSFHLKTAL
jgi:acyl-CoA reductase-like NAD-dependent aldehyde dehydrogenase